MPNETALPFDPLSRAHLHDPWDDYRWLRDHAPIVWHAPTQSWLISRYEHIRPLLRDNQRLTHEYSQQQLGALLGEARIMTSMEGREHTARRALVSPFLYTGGLERFSATIEERAHALLEPVLGREADAVRRGARDRAALDLVREFSSVYPIDIMASMLALPTRDFGRFSEWYNAWIDTLANIAGDPEIFARGLRAKAEFGAFILPIIAARRASPGGEDLISLLCAAELDGERMDDEDIRTFLALMLLAGGETTDHQLAALTLALAEHPEQLAELEADRTLMDDAMAEGMRYCSIIRFIQREVREPFELDGQPIEAGVRVTLLLSSGNRDPRRFADPDRFDIHRTDNATTRAFTGNADHVGFGGGRHVCLGTQLSKREVEIAMNLLLDHATDLRVADDFRPEWGGILVRSLSSLPLTYRPR